MNAGDERNTETGPEPSELALRLRELAVERYHHRHPFNLLMHAGRLSKDDLRLWVANRYYYQTRIPLKDALILAKAEDPAFRRVWIRRLLDHDGRPEPEANAASLGGLELWLRLGSAVGLGRAELEEQRLLLPEVKRACDDYVELVRSADLLSAVASSLTERFAGDLMRSRLDAWLQHYPWVTGDGLRYFEVRVTRAHEDAQFALRFVEEHARTHEQRQACLAAFTQKCDILWRLLDAVYFAGRRELLPRLAPHVIFVAGSRTRARAPMLLCPEQCLELNPSATELIDMAQGSRTLGQITEELARQREVPESFVEQDVATFFGELERRRVLLFSAQRGCA